MTTSGLWRGPDGTGTFTKLSVNQAVVKVLALRLSTNLPEGKHLRKGSYISIELDSATPVPEWGDQKVYIMEEDDAYLTDDGFKTFLPRQTSLYAFT